MLKEENQEEIICTIGDLYEYSRENSIKSFSVKSEKLATSNFSAYHGFFKILNVDITEKAREVVEIFAEGKYFLCGSLHHRVFAYRYDFGTSQMGPQWISLQNLTVQHHILTDTGWKKIHSIIKKSLKVDLLDLQIKEVESYFTNGILSHNSTINSAITYSLYGKSPKKKLEDLPNRINKSLHTEISLLTHKNKEISISRGISPSFFTVEIDNEVLDVAGKKNLQEILEKEYFEIPYSIFNNIISLSINDFKSFISMSPGDKRAILDKLFGLESINKMYASLKADIKLNKELLSKVQSNKEFNQEKIDDVKKKIAALQEKSNKELEEKLISLEADRDKYSDSVEFYTQKLQEIEKKIQEISTKIGNGDKKKIQFEQKLSLLNSKLKIFDQGLCPTCGSDLQDDSHKEEHKLLKEKQIPEIRAGIQKLEIGLTKIKEELSQFQSLKSEYAKGVLENKNHLQFTQREIQHLQESNKSGNEVESLESLIQEMSKKLQELNESEHQILEELSLFSDLEFLLEENGVKKNILQSIIPSLNSCINDYLRELNIAYKVVFQEDFSCNIFHMREEISVDTLSEGEKKKANFAVLLAFLQLFKTKFSTLNIVFLDEIFSSIDEEGRYEIITILNRFIEKYKMHIFVINHAEMPRELFSRIYRVNKNEEFSNLSLLSE